MDKQRPIVAFLYDFDKTLCTTDMEDYAFIPSLGMTPAEFWGKANGFGHANRMDGILAYMYTIIRESEQRDLPFTRESLREMGRDIVLFPGVREWFGRINAFGDSQGVQVEHYIISSGLREMIEGTSIARRGVFERIYACSFYFNERGVEVWPAQAVNYTNKTQFLFRIEKGVLDPNDPSVNDYIPPEQMRVPFRNMVYIGDSDTDIPCMKLVTTYGGHAIGVYDPATEDRRKVHKMMRDRRIRYFAPADYTEGSPIEGLVRAIIDKTAAYEVLEEAHARDSAEAFSEDAQ